MVKISRRDFLKGSGATALSLMAAGLVGCSTEKEKTPEVTTPTTAPENDKIAAAYLNPQREDYRTNTKELLELADSVMDFAEAEIVQRNSKILFEFLAYMYQNGLLNAE